jgi:uncharacterized membrane protein
MHEEWMTMAATRLGQLSHQVRDNNTAERRRERRELQQQGRSHFVNVGRGERVLSALAGGLLATWGLRRRGAAGYGAALVGAELLYRGVSGHCMAYTAMGVSTSDEPALGEVAEVDRGKAVDVRRSIEVARPREELFAIWRDFSQLPHFMTHLERVDVLSPTRSHWVTKGPIGTTVEWDAEIVDERPGEWIAWQAVEPAQVPNNGTVMFRDLPDGGTEIFVTIEAQPPAGRLGDLVARMFGRSPDRQVRMALEKFKEMAEGAFDWQSGSRGASATTDREVGIERHSMLGDEEGNDDTAGTDGAGPFRDHGTDESVTRS